MSPAEQSFVQPERETCEVRLEVFVRESGEKECTEVDSREEKGAAWTGVDGRQGRRKEGREERKKEGRTEGRTKSGGETTKYLSIARAGEDSALGEVDLTPVKEAIPLRRTSASPARTT